jgi:uncharacterized protein YjiS (DUF1127 family)
VAGRHLVTSPVGHSPTIWILRPYRQIGVPYLNTEELAASLRSTEERHGLNAEALRSAVIQTAEQYDRSRYALAKALVAYKAEMGHGAWMDASRIISNLLQLSDRTLREIMSGYKQTLTLSSAVVDELKRVGIDPVSGHGRKVVSALKDADVTELSPLQAVDLATRKVALMSKPAMPEGTVPPTKEEMTVYKVRLAVRSALSNVPPNNKLAILRQAIAEEVYALIGAIPAFTVLPMTPTLDLMGMKRIDSFVIENKEAA